MERVRVCFQCKVFVRIIETDPENLKILHLFDRQHSEHPIQVVNISELDNSYSEVFDLKQE